VEPNLKGVIASFKRYFKNNMIAVRRPPLGKVAPKRVTFSAIQKGGVYGLEIRRISEDHWFPVEKRYG